MRALLEETRGALRAALRPGEGSCALAFAAEVVRQVAHPLGAAPARDALAAEREAAGAVLALLRGAFGGDPVALDAAARRLSDDAPLLAACFQNLDLLTDCARGHDRAVAALVARALERPGG